MPHEPQSSTVMFLGFTKTQFLGALVLILALSTIGQAWTIFSVTHLNSTQASLCHIVAGSNAAQDQARARIQDSAARFHRLAALEAGSSQALRSLPNSPPAVVTVQHNFASEAQLNEQAGLELDQQAAALRPLHLAGC